MYETHRGKIDSHGAFVTDLDRAQEGASSETEASEFVGESGNIFLLKPKKAAKSRSNHVGR